MRIGMPRGANIGACLAFWITLLGATPAVAQDAGTPVQRIIITSLRTPDSVSRAAATIIRSTAAEMLGGHRAIVSNDRVEAIRTIGYGDSASTAIESARGLSEIGRLLLATYVVDVTLRQAGSEFEVSGVRLEPAASASGSASAKELPAIRGKTVADAARAFARRLVEDRALTQPRR